MFFVAGYNSTDNGSQVPTNRLHSLQILFSRFLGKMMVHNHSLLYTQVDEDHRSEVRFIILKLKEKMLVHVPLNYFSRKLKILSYSMTIPDFGKENVPI